MRGNAVVPITDPIPELVSITCTMHGVVPRMYVAEYIACELFLADAPPRAATLSWFHLRDAIWRVNNRS